ncbi:MAG TPA: hypothetical protein VNB90_01320 [Cytophagaceae bacterium]|jgi:antitoxin component YwqK of YwqJK toxin-antitoxin module|nr:hypothetical protein [Cytophagaceae bacterium]
MKFVYIFFGLLILISCDRNESPAFEYKEFYEGKERVEGRFLNGQRDGVFTHYYPNGDVARIRFYENGHAKGGATDYYPNNKLMGYAVFLEKTKGTYQLLWHPNGDTMIVTDGKFSRGYYKDGKPRMYSYVKENFSTIIFEESGRIKQFTGPLDYLRKRDSFDLDKAYPDWKERVREWEEK